MASFDLPQLSPLKDSNELNQVLTAVSGVRNDSSKLAKIIKDLNLSSQVIFQGIEATPEGVFRVGTTENFQAVANVYYIVNYSTTSQANSMSDSRPAYINGHFDAEKRAVVDDIKVDMESSGD